MAGSGPRIELQAALRRVYALPRREQMEVLLALRDFLGTAAGEETPVDRQLRLRVEALSAIQAVATHLKLPEGRAPTAQQFDAACAELGFSWRASTVAGPDVWGRWRTATNTFRGVDPPLSPAQRAIRRGTSGRQRTHETYIAGVAQWLDTNPASTTRDDYDDYADDVNRAIAGDADGVPLVKAASMCRALALTWSDILECAGGADYAEVAARRAAARRDRDAGPLGLVGQDIVSLMLGSTTRAVQEAEKRPGFPRPVAFVGRTKAWLIDDIAAYRDGRPVPPRQIGELQDRVVYTEQLAEGLGITPDSVRAAIHRQARYVPAPEGRVGQSHYWTRDGVERWKTERDE